MKMKRIEVDAATAALIRNVQNAIELIDDIRNSLRSRCDKFTLLSA
jgi:hypothetical protein